MGVSALAPALACAGGGNSNSDAGSGFTTATTTGVPTTTSTSDGESTDTGSTDDGSTSSNDGDPLLDVGPGDGADNSGPAFGCTKVDLLFVVDNSASMGQYQTRLTEEFPTFITAMYDALPTGTDIHVGITTTTFAGPFECTENEVEMNCQSSADVATITDNLSLIHI